MTTYCTYITVHEPTGYYYIGKTKIKNILKGIYKGSGVKLHSHFKKYPMKEWVCEILWEFETSAEALSDEAGIVTEELLKDPLCLNLKLGGEGGQTSEGWKRAIITMGPEGLSARAKKRIKNMTQEQLSKIARKGRASLTAEERSDIMKRGKASMSNQEKIEALRKRAITIGPERMSELAKIASEKRLKNTTHEKLSEIAKRAVETLHNNPEKLEAAIQKRKDTIGHERFQEIGRKAWVTRRARMKT